MRISLVHNSRTRTILLTGILAGALVLTASAGQRLERRPRIQSPGDDPIYLPQAQFLGPLSLGYRSVLADILWFRTINYFGEHYRGDRTYAWLAYMCDLVTDLDPRADYVYRFAGMILPWEAHQADEGIRLLEKGVHNLPESWVLHYWLGFAYYFFKADYRQAAIHMGRAAALPGAHRTAAHLAALLYQQQYGPEMTQEFLKDIAQNGESQEIREVAQAQFRETIYAADIERLNGAVREYHNRFRRNPSSVASLLDEHLIAEIPTDPFGGSFVIDPASGAVSSTSGHPLNELHRSAIGDAALRGDAIRD